MSRVGNKSIPIPDGVSVKRTEDIVEVKGPKGTLTEKVPTAISMTVADGTISFARVDEKKETRALHGLARALVNNMVCGVVTPFVKELEIQGVGYRADVSGKNLNLNVGYSHPVAFPVPEGLKVSVDRNVIVKIEGIDRCRVGQFAANVRAVRPPEPYKGKGIRYLGEQIRRKVGKAATGSGS
jgi:large subunit ribosomal protein L6